MKIKDILAYIMEMKTKRLKNGSFQVERDRHISGLLIIMNKKIASITNGCKTTKK